MAGHRLNSSTGSFLKSSPNLKESPGAMCFKNNQKGFFSLLKGLQKEDLVHCREDFVFGGKCPLSNSQGGLTSYRHRVEAGKNIQRHQALMTRNSP